MNRRERKIKQREREYESLSQIDIMIKLVNVTSTYELEMARNNGSELALELFNHIKILRKCLEKYQIKFRGGYI